MPENTLVNGIHLRVQLETVGLDDYDYDEGVTDESVDVVLSDDLQGIMYEFDEEINFYELGEDQLAGLAYMLADHIAPQILDSLLEQRDTLAEAEEIVTLIDRYEDGDNDWEV